LPIFHGIGLLANIINLASYNLKLRKGLIILTRGLLLSLPARPVDIHFRSEDLSKRAIVLMPDIVNFPPGDLKLWLVARGWRSEENKIGGEGNW
jgi:hypothetical protein